MEEQENKYLESLSKKIIKNASVESPSINFTDAIMSKINALPQSESTVYKPLISKTTWLIIGLIVLSLILFFGTKTEHSSWIQFIDFSRLSNLKINIFSKVSLSKTFTYAIIFLGLMICIQIPLLKIHFDKRFE